MAWIFVKLSFVQRHCDLRILFQFETEMNDWQIRFRQTIFCEIRICGGFHLIFYSATNTQVCVNCIVVWFKMCVSKLKGKLIWKHIYPRHLIEYGQWNIINTSSIWNLCQTPLMQGQCTFGRWTAWSCIHPTRTRTSRIRFDVGREVCLWMLTRLACKRRELRTVAQSLSDVGRSSPWWGHARAWLCNLNDIMHIYDIPDCQLCALNRKKSTQCEQIYKKYICKFKARNFGENP